MWTEITRPHYEREGRRYASDATDAEWALIEGLLPPAKRGGRPRTTDLRDVFDAILYMASSGCQWRMLPNDFPAVSTVRRYFYHWRDIGLLRTINHHLVMAAREAMEFRRQYTHFHHAPSPLPGQAAPHPASPRRGEAMRAAAEVAGSNPAIFVEGTAAMLWTVP